MKTKVFFFVCMLLLTGSQGVRSQSNSVSVISENSERPTYYSPTYCN